MNALKVVLVVFVFSLTLFSVSNVGAGEYLGDFCSRLEVDSKNADGIWDMRLAVVHIGNQHYSVYGKAELVNFDGEGAVHGNAEIGSDGKIIFTLLVTAGDGKEMISGTVNIKLDDSSHGRFQWIVLVKEGELSIVHDGGDITIVPCK